MLRRGARGVPERESNQSSQLQTIKRPFYAEGAVPTTGFTSKQIAPIYKANARPALHYETCAIFHGVLHAKYTQ